MAVTRADKEQELQELTTAFKRADTAILVDYRGLDVPAVTELRRQIRSAKGSYKVVKLLPSEGDDYQYRIKSSGEAFERVAKESQLDRA